jgi:hypothetical protein
VRFEFSFLARCRTRACWRIRVLSACMQISTQAQMQTFRLSGCRIDQRASSSAVKRICSNGTMLNRHSLPGGAGSLLRDIMSTDMTVATPETTVEDLRKMFTTITGLPVVESAATRKLVGVVSKKDLEKRGNTVKEVRHVLHTGKTIFHHWPTARAPNAGRWGTVECSVLRSFSELCTPWRVLLCLSWWIMRLVSPSGLGQRATASPSGSLLAQQRSQPRAWQM